MIPRLPILRSMVTMRAIRRLLLDVVHTECGCWNLNSTSNTYPSIKIKGVDYKASRLSYVTFCGPLGPYDLVCHHCDNPKCVNPWHLFKGTHQDNYDDMRKKHRNRNECGSDRYCAKLNDESVCEIRRIFQSGVGVNISKLARRYHVSRMALYFIKYGLRWKHVTV